MKKLMRVRTNANNMLVTYDNEENIVRVLPDSCKININYIDLKDVEDDSSWNLFEDVENINDIIGNESEIVEEIEVDF